MMARPRPGVPLSDDERWVALLGRVVDDLEAYQAPTPNPDLTDIIATVRFVRRGLLDRQGKQAPAHDDRQLELPFND